MPPCILLHPRPLLHAERTRTLLALLVNMRMTYMASWHGSIYLSLRGTADNAKNPAPYNSSPLCYPTVSLNRFPCVAGYSIQVWPGVRLWTSQWRPTTGCTAHVNHLLCTDIEWACTTTCHWCDVEIRFLPLCARKYFRYLRHLPSSEYLELSCCSPSCLLYLRNMQGVKYRALREKRFPTGLLDGEQRCLVFEKGAFEQKPGDRCRVRATPVDGYLILAITVIHPG